ncbi:hypothetical protein Tco_1513314, partial [Tanacetum coccineum]
MVAAARWWWRGCGGDDVMMMTMMVDVTWGWLQWWRLWSGEAVAVE